MQELKKEINTFSIISFFVGIGGLFITLIVSFLDYDLGKWLPITTFFLFIIMCVATLRIIKLITHKRDIKVLGVKDQTTSLFSEKILDADSMWLTHFRNIPPLEPLEYRESIDRAIKRNHLSVKRIVACDPEKILIDPRTAWLKEHYITEPHKKQLRVLPYDGPIPFEMAVFDEKEVILVLPNPGMSDETDADKPLVIEITEPKAVRSLIKLYRFLESKSTPYSFNKNENGFN